MNPVILINNLSHFCRVFCSHWYPLLFAFPCLLRYCALSFSGRTKWAMQLSGGTLTVKTLALLFLMLLLLLLLLLLGGARGNCRGRGSDSPRRYGCRCVPATLDFEQYREADRS